MNNIVGYTSTVHLTGGGNVSNLISLTNINNIVDRHQSTGSFLAEDLDSKEIVSIYKDAIDVVVFKPIYKQEDMLKVANDNNKISESEGCETTEASSTEDIIHLPYANSEGC